MINSSSTEPLFSNFTETEYRSLIRIAKVYWKFIDYSNQNINDPAVLWRHDIDYSVHRALAMANIEAMEDVSSTYFILLHSNFYNPLEKDVANIIATISNMGHALGLHFDPAFYGSKINTVSDLVEILKFEKSILEYTFCVEIRSFSWHNPTVTSNNLPVDVDEIAGMINVYGKTIKSKYSYVSDSNGLWRHRPLKDVLENQKDFYLQVLTHPEWWVPNSISPRDRILRAVNGRAQAAIRNYDKLLETYGRPNVGKVNNDINEEAKL